MDVHKEAYLIAQDSALRKTLHCRQEMHLARSGSRQAVSSYLEGLGVSDDWEVWERPARLEILLHLGQLVGH